MGKRLFKFLNYYEKDIIVKIPPIRKQYVRAKVKSVKKAKPCIIIDSFLKNAKNNILSNLNK